VGAVVNSTLTLLSLLSTGDFVGLMPEQAMSHRIAREFLSRVPVAEAGLALRVGAIIRNASSVAPAVQHFISHLHQAARRHAQAGAR
jgi:DNA-binding transcriptional LysR family regulator